MYDAIIIYIHMRALCVHLGVCDGGQGCFQCFYYFELLNYIAMFLHLFFDLLPLGILKPFTVVPGSLKGGHLMYYRSDRVALQSTKLLL